MPRTSKKSELALVVDNQPSPTVPNSVIAILPMEQGVFAWVVEPTPPPRRPFHF